MSPLIDMERRSVLVVAVATYILILAGALPRSASTSVERPDGWCGQYKNEKWAVCDQGRCCTYGSYCGGTHSDCSYPNCWFSCYPAPTPGGYSQSNHEVAGTGGVVPTRLAVNATHNNHIEAHIREELNVVDDDGLVEVAPANASSSSSSSSSAPSPLSCARSLSLLPLASRHKYPFAALPAPLPQNNITMTHCGRCVKVTTLGVGGLPHQVKVRIAHEHNKQGLELDFNTFKKLDIDESGIAKGPILVKYEFIGC